MSDDISTRLRTKVRPKTERPRLHKVILVNDDFTPREFVVTVLKAEFRMSEDQAHRVMITAHRRGVCVVAVYAQGHRRDQGDAGDRRRPEQGIPAPVHDRAGGIGGPSALAALGEWGTPLRAAGL